VTRPHTDQKDRDLLDDGGVALSVEPANDDESEPGEGSRTIWVIRLPDSDDGEATA